MLDEEIECWKEKVRRNDDRLYKIRRLKNLLLGIRNPGSVTTLT
jgi:hypothetical protein